MLYPSPSDWVNWGITDECHQFFCLHWAELFDPETPDTWQVRACNVKTILRELIEASRMAGGFDAYRGVMRSILDEAFAIVKRDVILENRYPFVSAYLAPWAKGEIGKEAVSEIERLAIVLLGNLDGYWDDGVQLLKDMLGQADKGKKKELYCPDHERGGRDGRTRAITQPHPPDVSRHGPGQVDSTVSRTDYEYLRPVRYARNEVQVRVLDTRCEEEGRRGLAFGHKAWLRQTRRAGRPHGLIFQGRPNRLVVGPC